MRGGEGWEGMERRRDRKEGKGVWEGQRQKEKEKEGEREEERKKKGRMKELGMERFKGKHTEYVTLYMRVIKGQQGNDGVRSMMTEKGRVV
jgi:hypothetical protein